MKKKTTTVRFFQFVFGVVSWLLAVQSEEAEKPSLLYIQIKLVSINTINSFRMEI
jgi:hypothetical protein